jgi:hypothetical protein
MLLTADPGEPWEYGCAISVPYLDLETGPLQRPALTVAPESLQFTEFHGLRMVRMHIDGILLQFLVGSSDRMEAFPGRGIFLQRDGGCLVGVDDATNSPYLRDALGGMFPR